MKYLLRNPWLGLAGYPLAALGLVVYLYGQITPFASYGYLLGIQGTPTLLSADGRILPGAAPKERIEQWLLESGR